MGLFGPSNGGWPDDFKRGVGLRTMGRISALAGVIIHESVTGTRDACVSTLKTRKLGVHVVVDRDGSVTWHVPLDRSSVHAAGHNANTIAVEVINPYYQREGYPFIAAKWAHKGAYVLPTERQLQAVNRVVSTALTLHNTAPSYPADDVGAFKWGRQSTRATVQAHHRSDHADGLFPEHYCWRRFHGDDHATAYAATLAAAMGK